MAIVGSVERIGLDGTATVDYQVQSPVKSLVFFADTATITLQAGIGARNGNLAGQFFTLRNGQSFTFENADGTPIAPFTLSLYAASAVTVQVVKVYP